jgi:AraC-like DNA-binding protein
LNVRKFSPEIDKIYFAESHTLYHIQSGKGSIQVDFKNYSDWQEKAIFLEKGQYIRFMSSEFNVQQITFTEIETYPDREVRVLFKHLISMGYIDLNYCSKCQAFLSGNTPAETKTDIIDLSCQQWFCQNPFNATKEEYEVIFDVKDIIDQEFRNKLTSLDLSQMTQAPDDRVQRLIKDKLGISLKRLFAVKRLQESQRDIAFTDKNIQEIAYDMGYKDDAYFNRSFQQATGQTPLQFRKTFDYKNRETFAQDILGLVQQYHGHERALPFYADKMNLSVKALSKKVQAKMNTSLGQLIRHELIYSAQNILQAGETVSATSKTLGFSETNHFTRFFKRYTGVTPSEYQLKSDK